MNAWFHVHGRVQGVGFRWFVVMEAQSLDLAGWVRNEPDGTVAGMAAGDLSRLEAFRERLAQGPTRARVSALDWRVEDAPQSLPHPFEIRP